MVTLLPVTTPGSADNRLRESFELRSLVSRRLIIVVTEFNHSIEHAVANGGRQVLKEALSNVEVSYGV
jgi:6,7-dimethyl-8-ribityllumazine synthase